MSFIPLKKIINQKAFKIMKHDITKAVKLLGATMGVYISRRCGDIFENHHSQDYLKTRALDTIARLFQIRSDCCAIDATYNSDNRITELRIAFNSKTSDSDISKFRTTFLQQVQQYPSISHSAWVNLLFSNNKFYEIK
jgi:hypothetical protein